MSRSKKDSELWNTWRDDPSKENLATLLEQVNPILQKEVNRWQGGSVARPVLEIQAKKLAIDAFSSYNPGKAALNTHVTNQLKGLSRNVYTYTSPARMPEHRQVKASTFRNVEENLRDSLSRDPTTAELAQELKWSQREVARYRDEQRATYSTSLPVPPGFEQYNPEQTLVDFVYHDLVDQDKRVFEHTTGYGGAQILSGKQLSNQTGMTQGQISHSKRRIRKLFEGAGGI
jgi:DNA-directed RNA polymerase specialized sigma subunit